MKLNSFFLLLLETKRYVRYVSNSAWSRTITNENTYWTIIIFNFQTVIASIFLNANICIILTVFQRFDELVFSLWRRVFYYSGNKAALSSRGIPPNGRSSNLQRIVKNSWQQQNPWKISLNELNFNENSILQCAITFTGKMKLIKLRRYLSSFSWSFFDNSCSTELLSEVYLDNPVENLQWSFFWKNS